MNTSFFYIEGDPDDKTLRTNEIKVLIPQIVRERARKEKCTAEVAEFEKCCKATGLMMAFKCRPQTAILKECMGRWYYDDAFFEECKQVYLDQRSEYRRTGISKKQKERMAKAAEKKAANNA